MRKAGQKGAPSASDFKAAARTARKRGGGVRKGKKMNKDKLREEIAEDEGV